MNLEERVQNLERQNRRFRQLLVGIVALVGVVIVTGSAPQRKAPHEKEPQEKQEGLRVVKAHRFEVIDTRGNVRATFGMFIGGDAFEGNPITQMPRLVFWKDAASFKPRAYMTASGITVDHPDGKGALYARMSKFGPYIILTDEHGKGVFYEGAFTGLSPEPARAENSDAPE